MLVFPVANGVLPKPQGGRITGMFVVEQGGQMLVDIGVGNDIVACPWIVDEQALYPVGVISRIVDLDENSIVDTAGQEIPVLIAVLEGREHVRWLSLKQTGQYLQSDELEELDFRLMRKEYPVISSAGWMPEGGYTEFRDSMDIPVTVYGKNLQTGQQISIDANLGGLVTQEQAHTIEHAIIRSLRTYCLCTPRTLAASIVQETDELKKSLDFSIRHSMPETLGLTASGACGNAMTNMAQIYLAHDFVQNMQAGKSLNDSLIKARRTTMSQLTQDLGLTMQSGLRVLQGLKKGLSHDDTPLKLEIYKKVIKRFPMDPWE
ncbi:hypothetical protein [Anaerospora sp.]|jgi:hypothetical protein|uniref:hypothetical protein n=1 Tax=Anaerospora sp. TaxID=1960278 RepID=UPI0028964A0B|nr:hypothetical protein [Anaerospora sp.]MDF2928534.1 hypothetical protein [Anaerospora sp.]